MKVLITGSTGFVGSRLVQIALKQGWKCVEVKRLSSQNDKTSSRKSAENSESFQITDISSNTQWEGAFNGVDCVVHCAARVHQMNESEAEAKSAYHEVNTLGTLHLAKQAAQSGVKRFVFLSSIKVNGEATIPGESFKPDLTNKPTDPYGLSKYDAEVGLQKIAQETGLEVVIIRPPLVYGPNVQANFLSMMNIVAKGLPLPLGAIDNKRSMVYLDNLVDLILLSCVHPKVAGRTLLVSDDHDVSISYMLKSIAKAMKKRRYFLLPIPPAWLKLAAKIVGKSEVAQRLCGNLQLDIQETKSRLEWEPPFNVDEGIQRTVDHYMQKKK
ncbi:UDP-glucose 4-epimerase family protein [Vibrio algarum]|uniref:SDR family oxidoreductase n=1 Tax=Vibrio algarum TaxID=3020714 RepID=A0ABT4YLI5_9VIBR|nr:SDR family oxidoreductase [Vibrio sp. KJ40-1]MDB1122407.1 SDR family oxidoreductase [Vibrio sp. KJ40-1]